MIFFEEISAKDFLFVRWYLIKKEKIYFLRVHKSCHTAPWFAEYIAKGRLEKSAIRFESSSLNGFCYDAAFDNVERFFYGYSGSVIVKNIRKLYNDTKTDLAFKKTVTQRLSRFYYLNFILDAVQKTYAQKRIIFIPSKGVEFYRTDGCDIYDYFKFYRHAQRQKAHYFKINTVTFSLLAAIASYGNAFRRKIILLGEVIAMPVWLLFTWARNYKKHFESTRRYDYAITIVSPDRQFANEIQKVDFLVDNEFIKKEQVIFIAPKGMTEYGKKYFTKNNLHFVDDINGYISFKIIAAILPVYFTVLCLLFKAESAIVTTGLKGIYFYAIWKSFIQHIKIKKFVTYCDYEIKGVFRNIILEQDSCKTYLYMDSTNFGCFAAKKGVPVQLRHHFFGFLHYDWFISWNDKASDFFRHSFCQIKQYINVGCFWAEHLRLIQSGAVESHSNTCLQAKGYKSGMKLISAFDSTFHDDSMTSYGDGIEFLKGLYNMIEQFPDIFLVLKEKKSRDFHKIASVKYKDILALYKKFDEHQRCYLSGSKENSSEMMAFSNLVISFPFTSTTFEALAMRKKAIWYDASDRFRDTFYDDIPGLVCHNYEDLLCRVKDLLYNTPQAEYDTYLDKYIKGKVESYLDGKAISRFRQLLVKG